MTREQVTRRRFLALAGLAAAAGAAAGIKVFVGGGRARPRSPAARTANALFDDPGAARRVGNAYLDLRPEERGAELLARRLAETDSELGRALRAGDVAALRRLAGRHGASELAGGRAVMLDGWLVAPTEARLAALATYA